MNHALTGAPIQPSLQTYTITMKAKCPRLLFPGHQAALQQAMWDFNARYSGSVPFKHIHSITCLPPHPDQLIICFSTSARLHPGREAQALWLLSSLLVRSYGFDAFLSGKKLLRRVV